MKPATALALAAALGCMAASSPTRADDVLSAEAAFAEARSLMAQGRFAEACPRLEASYKLDPALGTLMNHAECLRQVGRTASAWLRYRTAAAEALRLGQAQREQIARDRARALEGQLCRVRLRQGALPLPQAGEVSRDGGPPEPLLLDVAVPADPGEHAYVFTAPGREPQTVRLTVRAPQGGGACSETVVVVPAASEPVSKPAEPTAKAATVPLAAPVDLGEPSPPPLHSSWRTSHTLAVVAGATGVVALGVGSAFGLDAISQNRSGNTQCTAQGCSGSGATTLHDAGRSADVATVLFTTGAAALVTGVVLWLVSPSLRPSNSAALLTF